jgi:hypothetical protein
MPRVPQFEIARRNPRIGPLKLPRGGRKGPTPKWPIPGGASVRVLKLWDELWHTPQAVAWEQLEWTRVVARYALVVLSAEALDRVALGEARQFEDRLGLSPKAMRLLLWEITDDELAEARQTAATDARERIKAVG